MREDTEPERQGSDRVKTPLLIAHRALFEGPDSEKENHPEQIDRALASGFDCEVDLWRVDGKCYLGHDAPTYPVDTAFLETRNLWIHAKNLHALHFLTYTSGLHYFWHENDAYTLTSKNYIWTYPGKPLTKDSITVLPELHDPTFESLDMSCFGICSDFVLDIKKRWQDIPSRRRHC